ncbi:MAG: DUF3306 domain-containing protein [Polaromonas sp.]
MAEAADGFLGRWARRKNDALLGKPLSEPALVAPPPVVVPTEVEAPPQEAEPLPVLSLDDVKLLTKDSDFKPFMAQNVGPEVRNAAMKKLFEDPHFNVMDGLDIYIDDYSISEPIPESMLRQMASAKFLNLFEEDEDEPDGDKQKDQPAASADQSVSQSPMKESAPPAPDSAAAGIDPSSQPEVHSTPVASQENHANPYLRLQPDHAPSAPEAGRGP